MKGQSPGMLAFVAAVLISVVASGILLLVNIGCSDTIHWNRVFITVALIFGASWIILYQVLKAFIYKKIMLIFRNMSLQRVERESYKLDMNSDVLTDVNKQVVNWASDQMAEIQDLREKENFRKEFVGNVAHELKTPIFSIQGYILTLLEGAIEDPKVNRKFLKKAAKSAERMALLVEDLDTITQFESGNLKLDLDRIDIVELVREIMDSREREAEEKGIKLHFNKTYERPIYVVADAFRINQVLTNLIANSINYGHENGDTKISFFDLDDEVLIEVEDNGPGIAKKHLARLFERFYRVDKSRARHQGGTGLGLAICKHIIEAHKETITVRSEVGKGSVFSFTLAKA